MEHRRSTTLVWLLVGAAAVVLASGCRQLPGGFACTDDDQCRRETVQGRCEPTGFCSFPDTACGPYGYRYGDLAGGGLGGTCIGTPWPDGGLADGAGDAPRDGAPADGGAPDGAGDAQQDGAPPTDAPQDGVVQTDGPQTDAPPQSDAAQSDAGVCCDTCYDTRYLSCYDTCYETCYDQCCIYYWDTTYGCLSQSPPQLCKPEDISNLCDTGSDCGAGFQCRPFQCNPHLCEPGSCTLADCNCSPAGCQPEQFNPHPCNCRDC